MAYFSAQKASEDAIDILNRALLQERALSPFEITRIEKNLESVKRSGYDTEYNMASACFYAIVGDIDRLLTSANNVFCSKYAEPKDKIQVIFALNNALRYSEVYHYVSFLNELEFIEEPSFVDAVLSSYVINFDFEKARKLLSEVSEEILNQEDIIVTKQLSMALEDFFNKKERKDDYKKYIVNVLNWYSENLLGEARRLIGQSSLNYSFYEDEAIDFLSISIEFRSGGFDDLLDLEDKLITYISKSKFSSDVKSCISFSLGFKSEDDHSDMKDRVEVYD